MTVREAEEGGWRRVEGGVEKRTEEGENESPLGAVGKLPQRNGGDGGKKRGRSVDGRGHEDKEETYGGGWR